MNKMFVGVLCLGVWLLSAKSYSQTTSPQNLVKSHGQDSDEKGDPDDPGARQQYEWMRLRDPASGQIPADIRKKELKFAVTIPTKEYLARFYKNGETIQQVQTTTWNARGPQNVGGRTRALGVDLANESIMLAGGVSAGMWRTVNGGTSWTKVTNTSDLSSITCLAQDRRSGHTNTWYYGTGELEGNSASGEGPSSFRGDGIFKSTDDGVTWTLLSSTSTGTPQSFDQMFDYVWDVVTDSSNPSQDVVYAATVGGIKRSTDGGTTWTTVLGGFPGLNPLYTDVAITSSGVVYATMSQSGLSGTSTTKGIFRSPDGITWTNVTPGGWPASYNRITLGIAPSSQNIVYVFGETPGGGLLGHSLWKYVYLSGNGSGAGGTWVNRSANIPAFGAPVGDYDSQGSYDMYIKVKPNDTNTVFLGGTNLYRSTNGFSTNGSTSWIAGYSTLNDISLYPHHHPDQHALVFSSSTPTTMWTGDDGGVQKTTNNLGNSGVFPVAWTSLNNGYISSQYYTIAVDHATSGNNIIVGGTQDNGTWFTNTTNAGTSWVNILDGDGTYCAVADGRTSYFVSAQDAVIYRLILDSNGNPSGSPYFTRVDPTGGSGYLFVDPFLLDPNNTNMMYLAAGTVVWRNTNLTAIPLGSNSTATTNWFDMTNSSIGGGSVTALGISKNPANRLYYGTSDGRVFRINGADAGNPTPTNVSGVNFPVGAYVSCLTVDPANADNVIVVFSNYNVVSLFSSTDGGTTWTSIAGNLEQNPDGSGDGPSCRWAALLPGPVYFVGTSTGLYSTTTLNGSSTVWGQEGSSIIGNVVVDMIDTRSLDGLVAVATHGNGVYTANIVATAPLPPSLVSPANGAPNQPTTLPLSWNSSATATSYRVQVATDSVFASPTADDSTLVGTTKSLSSLANNTLYYWHVNAKNGAGTSPYSSARSFTTVIATPPTPVLASPTPDESDVFRTPTLLWHSSSGAATYRVQAATDSNFVSLVKNDSTITDTSVAVGPLFNGTKYWWRVNAKNVGGTSSFSASRPFTTILDPPSLLQPLAGASHQQPSLLLKWNTSPGATKYHVQLSVDSAFSSSAVDDSSLTDTTRLVSGLAVSTTYYWHVRSANSLASSAYSGLRQFSTITSTPPVPVLLNPLNNSSGQPTTINFGWNSSTEAATYDLQVATDSNFASIVLADSLLTDTTASASSLSTNTTHFWRVSGVNVIGQGGWSAPFHFTTADNTSAAFSAIGGWNMISLPLSVSDYRKSIIFPTSHSSAFAYAGSYTAKETLVNGTGYWLKFDTAQSINVLGVPQTLDSINVVSGWNMIGSVAASVPVSGLTTVPTGILTSNFFGYNGGYFVADSIKPFGGYWIKINQNGTIVLSSARIAPSAAHPVDLSDIFNQLIITDAEGKSSHLYFGYQAADINLHHYELPPLFSGNVFDARFSSQRMLETVEGNTAGQFRIDVTGGKYPLNVHWRIRQQMMKSFLSAGGEIVPLQGEGDVAVSSNLPHIDLEIMHEEIVPKTFVLEQNYPNPFNPGTTITYGLPVRGFVRLTVSNLLGQEVALLAEGEEQAGLHRVEFVPGKLSSGMYYYTLSTVQGTIIRKLVYMK